MRCSYCDKEMIKKYKIKHFCNFDDPCDSWEKEIHICKKCGIKKIDGKWKIPNKYRRPSTNQIRRCKTLAKIYDIDFEPLLARQCKRFITKTLKKLYVQDSDEKLHIIGENK